MVGVLPSGGGPLTPQSPGPWRQQNGPGARGRVHGTESLAEGWMLEPTSRRAILRWDESEAGIRRQPVARRRDRTRDESLREGPRTVHGPVSPRARRGNVKRLDVTPLPVTPLPGMAGWHGMLAAFATSCATRTRLTSEQPGLVTSDRRCSLLVAQPSQRPRRCSTKASAGTIQSGGK